MRFLLLYLAGLIVIVGCSNGQPVLEKRLFIANLALTKDDIAVVQSVNEYVQSGKAIDDALNDDIEFRKLAKLFDGANWSIDRNGAFELNTVVKVPSSHESIYARFSTRLAEKIEEHRQTRKGEQEKRGNQAL